MQLIYLDLERGYQTIRYTESRTDAGRSPGPSYRVAYRLEDGSWLDGIRHRARRELMTSVRRTRRQPQWA